MAFELTREFNINLQSGGGIGALVRSKTDLTPAENPIFIAGDKYKIRVRLLTPSGTVGQAPTPTPIEEGGVLKLGARPANDLEQDFLLFEAGSFTKEEGEGDVYYEAELDLNTQEFRDAVDAESPLELLLDLEVQSSGNAERITIPQFRGSGRQQVYRGTEPPTSAAANLWNQVHAIGTNADRPAAAPSNAGHLYAQTDGTQGIYRSNGSSWVLIADLGGSGGVSPSRTISAAGLATGGGDLSANRTITVPETSQADAEAGTGASGAMTARRVAQAIAALAGGGAGLTTGKVYGFTTNGAAAAFDTIADAGLAVKAAGGGGVLIPGKQTEYDEQVPLLVGVTYHALGGARISYTGLGATLVEPFESVTASTPNSVQVKITGDGMWRKRVVVSGTNGGTVPVSAVNTSTETLTTSVAHGFTAGMRVSFDESQAVPGGLDGSTIYHVISAGLTSTEFRVSTTAGGSAVNITTAGTNVRVRRRLIASIASIGTHSSGWTTVTTTAAHGFPRWFRISFSGTTTTPSLTTGTHWAERLSDTTFRIRASVTSGQGSAAGTAEMPVQEHCIRCEHAATHADCIGEHFDIRVEDIPQTRPSRFSMCYVKGAIVHLRNHTFRGRFASVLHMVSGFPDLNADGGCLGSGTGVVTLNFEGDGTSPAAGFPTSRFWLRAFRLEAGPNEKAVRVSANFPDVFLHLETQTWNGRFVCEQLTGGAVWLFFKVQSMAWSEDRSIPMTAPVFEIEPQNAGAVLPNGVIDLITGTHAAPVMVINNAADGMEDQHDGFTVLEISSEQSGPDSDAQPGVILTGRPGERFTLNCGTFRRYRPSKNEAILPVGIRLIGDVTLRGTYIHGCTNEAGVGGELWDNCRFILPTVDGEQTAPAVRSVTGASVECTFLGCYKSNNVALENVTGAGGEVPVLRAINPQGKPQLADGSLSITDSGGGVLQITGQPTWYPGTGHTLEYQWQQLNSETSEWNDLGGEVAATTTVSATGEYRLRLRSNWFGSNADVFSNSVTFTAPE